MARKKVDPITGDNAVKEMVKSLERISATGMGYRETFGDFMTLATITLDQLANHFNSVVQHGKFADDPKDMSKQWQAILRRYDSKEWVEQEFARMFHIMMASTTDESGELNYSDTLGQVYMQEITHGHNGEFYTPMSVSIMCAQMAIGDPEPQLREHLLAALADSSFGKMMALTGASANKWQTKSLVAAFDALDDMRAAYKPVTICDPACGSGGMLLAAASCYPRWAIDHVLVEFFGQDISQMAVQMASLNMRLYGLNGWGYRLTGFPSPIKQIEAEERVSTTLALPAGTIELKQLDLFAMEV